GHDQSRVSSARLSSGLDCLHGRPPCVRRAVGGRRYRGRAALDARHDVRGRAPATRVTRRLRRAPLLLAAFLSMTWGVWMGLLRLGWRLPLPWPDQLILRGPLMIGGFLGTLIGLERAVGVARPWAYAAPILTAAGSATLVLGPPGVAGPTLITAGSAVVVLIFAVVLRRQSSLFTWTMMLGATAWFIGNAWWLAGAGTY